MRKLFVIETVSQHRMVYCVEADSREDALSYYESRLSDLEEFGQEWLGETVFGSREVSRSEALRVFDETNGYLMSWSDEDKLSRVMTATREGGDR